jgi:V/A-type H+/Na+-transporting ATPase subunit C
METLAESTSLEELINRLRGTPYFAAVSTLQPPFGARKIELAFRMRLADVHKSLMQSAGRYEIFELYYMKIIAWDLKSALKSKALKRSYEESVEYVDLHSEELVGRRDLIVKVLSAVDIQEAATLLAGTEFGEDVERAVTAFSSTGEVRFFDLYLDHAVLTKIAKAYDRNPGVYSSPRAVDAGEVGEMVANDVGSYNVLSVLRGRLWGLTSKDIDSVIVEPAYRFQVPLLRRMVNASSTAEAIKLLPFDTPSAANDEQAIAALEDHFVAEVRQTAQKAFVWQGLGPAAALALIKLMELEVENLSAIAIGIEVDMPRKDILGHVKLSSGS